MREIQSLARGLQIIDILVNSPQPCSITELAANLEIDKSSASRLVRTMENYGYIQQAKNSRAYTVGKRIFTIGWQLTNRYALREKARLYLDDLAQKTGECAHIGVYSSGKALVTDDVQSESSLLRVVGNSGRLIHLHNTAVGKGLIAFGDFPLPKELPQITLNTITELSVLEDQLAKVRQEGYALDDEENEYGVRCLAAPVFDAMDITIATIGISGPTVRVTHDNIGSFAAIVKDAAYRLSCELGYEGEYPK
jgi:IclR family transcriptional regulator, KDG regulon repressor